MNILSMNNISKSFFGVPVLNKVSFEVQQSEILGLVGENGAGKSTLMNIVSGMLSKDEGDIYINGNACVFSHPIEAEKSGIIHIHQELNILLELSVIENLFLGKELHSFGLLNEKAMHKKAHDIFHILGLDIDITKKVYQLSLGHQQIIEIAKALLSDNPALIILDEPTSSLANAEIEKLFEVMLQLKNDRKVSFIYVSHRMNELFRICDRIIVLRDGECISSTPTKETNIDEVINMMIGRKIEEQYGENVSVDKSIYDEEPLLQVKNISKGSHFSNINFNVYSGEIFGFYGLVGSGRTDVLKAIFGAEYIDTGEILLHNKCINHNSPSHSIKQGIGFLSEDRKLEGVLSNFNVIKNISISNFSEISKLGYIDQKKEISLVTELIHKLSVKVSSSDISIMSLSGGNQQKALLSRCLNHPLQLLLLDEPTRGIDVGSKQDIYTIIHSLAQQGIAIIMVSSDLLEIIRVADRVAVMHEGNLMKILQKEELSQETIMYYSTNAKKGLIKNETNNK